MNNIKYIVVLQCHIVKERCSGFFCENAFTNRIDKFSDYPADKNIRLITITCGGCCGRATLRKLSNLTKLLKKHTNVQLDEITLHFASCISLESFHGPVCPNYDYLKELVSRKNLKTIEGSVISKTSDKRRDSLGKWVHE